MILGYQDYLRYYTAATQSSEGNFDVGGDGPKLTEDQWDALPPEEQWSRVNGGTLAIYPEDPRYDELKAKVGGEPGREIWVRPTSMANMLKDPSLEFKGEGFFAHSRDSQSPQYQESVHPGDLRNEMIRNVAIVIGGGLAAGAMGAGGAGASAGGGSMSTSIGGGFGTGALGAGGTGASFGTAFGAEGAALGATGSAGGAAATPTIETPPPVETTPPPTTPTPTTPTQPPPGTPPPATPAPTTPPPATTPGNGIINGVRSGFNTASSWYNGLSPAGRAIVNAGISTGASAALGANAQRGASEEADRREEEERQNRIRRGTVGAYVNPYTPKPAGIIGSAYTPKPTGG